MPAIRTGTILKSIAVLISSLVATAAGAAPFSGGSGTLADPYQIATLSELRVLSETSAYWGMHFVQTADIDATDTVNWNVADHDSNPATPDVATGFAPIGGYDCGLGYFTGSYDGRGHVIRNLYQNRPARPAGQVSVTCNGMFSNVSAVTADYPFIRNLGLVDAVVYGESSVGLLVGVVSSTGVVIDKVHTSGIAQGNTVNAQVGGLVGDNNGAYISNSFSRADVSGGSDPGLYGIAAGGLVGVMRPWSGGTLSTSYFAGTIGTGQYLGALVGYNHGAISDSLWDTDTSGLAVACGGSSIFGSTTNSNGETTTAMKLEGTFVAKGWDFAQTWDVVAGVNDGYPSFIFLTSYAVTGAASPLAGGSVLCTSPVTAGNTTTCAVTANTGYSISGASSDACGGSLSGSTFTTGAVTGDCVVTATFAAITYPITVNVSPAGAGSATCTPNPVGHGSTSACSISANAGYTLSSTGGTCSGTLTGNTFTTGAITASCSLDVNFVASSYAITASASPAAGGSVSCTPNPVSSGSTSACTVTTNAGYVLSGVAGTCGGSLSGSTYTTSGVTAACTVVASFTAQGGNGYAITASASPAAGGSVKCTPNPVASGATSSCAVTTNAGYVLSSVTGTCGGTLSGSTYRTKAVKAACSVTANFLATYAITTSVTPVGSGKVTCTPNPVKSGGSATCTATAASGYAFSAFGGACSGRSCTLTKVTSPKTVTATFIKSTPCRDH